MKRRFVCWASLPFLLTIAAGCSQGNPFLGSSDMTRSDGDYTIRLYVFSGNNRSEESDFFLKETKKEAGWKDLFVIQQVGFSELYWGKYDKPKDAERDLKIAQSWKNSLGTIPYVNAKIVPRPGNDPGPAEWNLRNAKGVYSVVIAVFFDVPEANYYGRKKIAVELVRQLREAGEEAYFFHGLSKSDVCVGAFPEEAILYRYEKAVWEPTIKDKRIMDIMNKHPYMAQNGYEVKLHLVNPTTKKYEWVKAPCYPFRIPREDGIVTDTLSPGYGEDRHFPTSLPASGTQPARDGNRN